MKILLITENRGAGGTDTWITNLINYWPENDDFYLIGNYDYYGLDIIEKRLRRKCVIIRHKSITMAQLKTLFSGNKYLNLPLNFLISLSQHAILFYHFIYFNRLFRKITPDRLIVANGGYPGGSTCRAAALTGLLRNKWGKPVMVYHNDAMQVTFPLSIIEYFVDRLIEKSVSYLITVSESTQRTLDKRPGLHKSRKKIVINNGIEYPIEVDKRKLRIKSELSISGQSRILLMLGTYEERKGHDFIFRALEIIRKKVVYDIHLLVAGYGYPQDIKRLVNLVKKYKLEDCVHLLGFRFDVPELLSQSDILVVPSQSKESFSLVIAEAMSYRVPAIATNIGGIPEVLRNNKGGFVVENDLNAFAEKVVYLLEEEEIRKNTGTEGYQEFMNRFTAEKMANKYCEVIKGKLG